MPKSADQALFEVLSAHAGLGALIGLGTDMRCYPVEAPQDATLPLLVYQAIADDPSTTHGEGGGDARLDGVLFQLTAMAASPLKAAAVLYQARLAIEANQTLGGVQVDSRAHPREEEADCYVYSADFLIWNDPDSVS